MMLLYHEQQLTNEAPVDRLESDPESIMDLSNRIQLDDFP